MAEQLTREYFDQKLQEKLEDQTRDLKSHIDVKGEELARMVKKGFDSTDEQLADIKESLDLRKELGQLQKDLQDMKEKLEQALHVKF